ncbi:hypothetical protein [Clostridium sporogenes]|uniref:hypothetical protein n=1 Tax=Clostridium sporogenes TaxID=1509 RepID=UPI0013D8091B|nr:hypothetical protein [Clostridium sporogenes]MCW6079693.1 hypothetical protein [Clostridium sporogenes]NFG03103.1 hypothetical protein [Clostridium sporogenes]
MRLEFPTKYEVDYPKENKKYYSQTYKKDIQRVLLEASKNYCMYCGKNLKIDSNFQFDIEHSIEKAGDEKSQKIDFLMHCKFNLSVACRSCNQIYKKRMIEKLKAEIIEKNINCSKLTCKTPCKEYLDIKKEYLNLNSIILQPMGVCFGENRQCKIEYDLLKHIFKPLIDEKTSVNEVNFIQEHISRFHLNREMFSECILEISEMIIVLIEEFGGNISISSMIKVLSIQTYNNVIGEIYIKFIDHYFNDVKQLYEFCKLMIVIDYI